MIRNLSPDGSYNIDALLSPSGLTDREESLLSRLVPTKKDTTEDTLWYAVRCTLSSSSEKKDKPIINKTTTEDILWKAVSNTLNISHEKKDEPENKKDTAGDILWNAVSDTRSRQEQTVGVIPNSDSVQTDYKILQHEKTNQKSSINIPNKKNKYKRVPNTTPEKDLEILRNLIVIRARCNRSVLSNYWSLEEDQKLMNAICHIHTKQKNWKEIILNHFTIEGKALRTVRACMTRYMLLKEKLSEIKLDKKFNNLSKNDLN